MWWVFRGVDKVLWMIRWLLEVFQAEGLLRLVDQAGYSICKLQLFFLFYFTNWIISIPKTINNLKSTKTLHLPIPSSIPNPIPFAPTQKRPPSPCTLIYKYVIIINNQHCVHNSTRMRSRSGGIHSNSEQEYIELADIAQQCKSLFYDQPKPGSGSKRRKYAFSVNAGKSDEKSSVKKEEKTVKPSKAFESFNFDQQSYSFAKDCQELTKIQQQAQRSTKKSNFAILSHQNTHLMTSILETILGIKQEIPEGPQRAINLCVHRFLGPQAGELYIDCYWVIDVSQIILFGSLFNVYIQKSSQVLDLRNQKFAHSDAQLMAQQSVEAIKAMVDKIHSSRAPVAAKIE